jgi:hypothetical protein
MRNRVAHERAAQIMRPVVALLFVVTAGCNATGVAPSSGTSPLAAPATSPPAPSAPPAMSPPAPRTPAVSSSPTQAADVVTGTWAATVTCSQENAALAKAGFTSAQLASAQWTATCGGLATTTYTIRFRDGKLVEFQDHSVGWEGSYKITDDHTFVAGDQGSLYITYHFVISGDRLTIDMVSDDFPSGDPTFGDVVAQTSIYESAPFARAP